MGHTAWAAEGREGREGRYQAGPKGLKAAQQPRSRAPEGALDFQFLT